MLNEFRRLADWLVFGSGVEEDGFSEAGVSDNGGKEYSNDPRSVRRVLSSRDQEVIKNVRDSGGGLIDLQCGKRVFNDAPAKMRTELWLSQLHSHMASAATVGGSMYNEYLQRCIDTDILAEIEKDIHRTFPGHHTLSTKPGQRAMSNVLRAYASFDPEVGYSQGMNFLSGMLLTYLAPPQAFDALVLIMKDRGLREYYKPNGMVHLQARLWQLGKLIPPHLEEHLEKHMVLPVLYASSWLLTCFASEFPTKFAARVMDVIITDSYHLPIMKVSLSILERCTDDILEMDSMEDIVDLIRKKVPKWPENLLQDLLTSSLGTSWSEEQLHLLENENKVTETVAETVQRIQEHNNADRNRHILEESNNILTKTETQNWTPEWIGPSSSFDDEWSHSARRGLESTNSANLDPNFGLDIKPESLLGLPSSTEDVSNCADSNIPGCGQEGGHKTPGSGYQSMSQAKSVDADMSLKLRDVILSQSMNYSQVDESKTFHTEVRAHHEEDIEQCSEVAHQLGELDFGDWQSE